MGSLRVLHVLHACIVGIFFLVFCASVLLIQPSTAAFAAESRASYAFLYSDGSLYIQRSPVVDTGKTIVASWSDAHDFSGKAPWKITKEEYELLNPSDSGDETGDGSIEIGGSSWPHQNYQYGDRIKSIYVVGELCPSSIKIQDSDGSTSTETWFSNLDLVTHIDVTGLNTSKLRDMGWMFSWCYNTVQIKGLEGFDTSRTSDMSYMFNFCAKIKELNLTSFETPRLTNIQNMFHGCTISTTLDLSSFDTRWVENSKRTIGLECCGYLEAEVGPNWNLQLPNNTDYPTLPWEEPMVGNGFKKWNCSLLNGYVYGSSVYSFSSATYKAASRAMWGDDSDIMFVDPLGEGAQEYKINVPTVISIDGKSYYVNEQSQTKDYYDNKMMRNRPIGSYLNGVAKPYNVDKMIADMYEQDAINDAAKSKSLTDAKVSVASKAYSGKTLRPSKVIVKLGKVTLRNGCDYTVSCKGGKKVGAYPVVVNGKGQYAGTLKTKFIIKPKAVGISRIYKCSCRKALCVKWTKPKGSAARQVSGYKIRYSRNKSMKAAKMASVAGAKKSLRVISNLQKGKKLYLQICAYKKVGGKTYVSSWSKVKQVNLRNMHPAKGVIPVRHPVLRNI